MTEDSWWFAASVGSKEGVLWFRVRRRTAWVDVWCRLSKTELATMRRGCPEPGYVEVLAESEPDDEVDGMVGGGGMTDTLSENRGTFDPQSCLVMGRGGLDDDDPDNACLMLK